jgi:hypothetical protein
MALASVTLSFRGTSYTFAGDDQTVLKGRLACDCAKSQLIREACDSEFPLLRCGSEIVVVSVVEVGNQEEKKPVDWVQKQPKARRAGTAN